MTMQVVRRDQRVTRMLMGVAALLIVGACGGDQTASGDRLPWRTVADSTGDTIIVRTVEVAADLSEHTLVPELRIGALDGAEEVTFGSVTDVLGLPGGGLLVHDGQAEIIRRYDATGAFVGTLGGKGGGPGEYGQVNGIARNASGDLFVWDATGSRVNRYGPDGTYRGSWRSPLSGWFTQRQLFADRSGHLVIWMPIIGDPERPLERREAYVRLDTAGQVVDTLLVPDWPGSAEPLRASSPDGRSQTMTTRPWAVNSAAAVHPDGGFVAGLGREYVFYRLGGNGKPLRIEREFTPVPVSSTEREERQAQIERSMRRLDPAWNWTGAPIPSTKPAYQRFLVGEDGRIWVQVYTAAEPIPAEDLAEPRPNPTGPPPVVLTTREPTVYDVFSPDGRYLGRVRVPAEMVVRRTNGDTAWGAMRDADDVPYAVRFRIEPALPPG